MLPSAPRNHTGLLLLIGLLTAMVVGTMAMPGPQFAIGPETGVKSSAALPSSGQKASPCAEPRPEPAIAPREAVPVVDHLQLQVRNARGEGVEQALVRFYQETIIGFPAETLGRTDGAGSFQSAALPAGTYRVRIEAPGFTTSKVQEICLPAPVNQTLEFVLLPAGA